MAPLVRSASLINYASLARQAGLDPLDMLAEVGLPAQALQEADLWISSLKVRALVDASARRSGWEDFGLRLAESRQFWVLGPLALAIREQATLRPMLEVLSRHIHLHNASLTFWLEEDVHTTSLHMELTGGGEYRQSTELSLATLFRLFRHALPEDWQPVAVCFSHGAPSNTHTAKRVFGPRLQFDAPFNGIVFKASDMDLPMATHTRLDEFTRQYLRWLTQAQGGSAAWQVRQLTLALLASGQCQLSMMARHLQVDERTLHRRLHKEGVRYSDLLNQTRRELVERYLSGAVRKQSELAQMLGFSGPTVFSRWFRHQYGLTPAQWRSTRRTP
jgi:AraC-like DNA-binding protein